MFITIEQIKAARALLSWNQKDLAKHAGLNDDQVHSFESGRTHSLEVLEAIHKAFDRHGLEFVDGGVMRKKHEIKVLHGQQGFWDFFDDVYHTVKEHGGDILIHNVDEAVFLKWLGNYWPTHQDRMMELKNFNQKIIICENDTNFAASFTGTEYRWAPAKEFSSSPFYLYGSKLAMVVFDKDNVTIFIIDTLAITESYRTLFMGAWDRAKIPQKNKGEIK